jgi:hypothetical protein
VFGSKPDVNHEESGSLLRGLMPRVDEGDRMSNALDQSPVMLNKVTAPLHDWFVSDTTTWATRFRGLLGVATGNQTYNGGFWHDTWADVYNLASMYAVAKGEEAIFNLVLGRAQHAAARGRGHLGASLVFQPFDQLSLFLVDCETQYRLKKLGLL